MKRKTEPGAEGLDAKDEPDPKKRALSTESAASCFRDGLLNRDVLEQYKQAYAESKPYKHGVISSLVAPDLLRAVRSEIQEHLSFTEKETDIYKIFQSGDLANLDGLDDASLSRFPALLKLRDALYSAPFRAYLSEITGAGKVSGRKTDMAINVYTPGCHLLCHDDVIGSRRVSYILYLTDPDVSWQPHWGGALRLYPTCTETDASGKEIKVPSPDYSVSILPAFNQLSFFAVQPGESFHDVEEVYHAGGVSEEDNNKQRVRMAISGWYHIPQEGEDGYEPGLEEKLAERSSLQQLQGQNNEFDLPQPQVIAYDGSVDQQQPLPEANGKDGEISLSEEDLTFLVHYLSPSYLTPDGVTQLSDRFQEDSALTLEMFLHENFAGRLRSYIEEQEKPDNALPKSAVEIEKQTDWNVSRPPHKHRYLYQQPRRGRSADDETTPLQELLEKFLPSQPFRKWLALVAGLGTADNVFNYDLLARRFRRGTDYTLASAYDGEEPRLEFTLGITPTPGWERSLNGEAEEGQDDDDDEEEEETKDDDHDGGHKNGDEHPTKTDTTDPSKENISAEDGSYGGYEMYMAGDDDGDETDEEDGDQEDGGTDHHAGTAVAAAAGDTSTGSANPRLVKKPTKPKSTVDPAVYKAAAPSSAAAETGDDGDDDDDGDGDDGILFSTGAAWNRMSIVLRDRGTLRFVKYVSHAARGDRWDVTGEMQVAFPEDEEEEDDNE